MKVSCAPSVCCWEGFRSLAPAPTHQASPPQHLWLSRGISAPGPALAGQCQEPGTARCSCRQRVPPDLGRGIFPSPLPQAWNGAWICSFSTNITGDYRLEQASKAPFLSFFFSSHFHPISVSLIPISNSGTAIERLLLMSGSKSYQ